MEANIQTALRLLIIGMSSVSAILLLVVFSSKILISIVNKTSPKSSSFVKRKKSIDPKVIAAINASIEVYTAGKARVESIKKI